MRRPRDTRAVPAVPRLATPLPLLDLVADPSAAWTRAAPASRAAVDRLRAALGERVPEEYLSFLLLSNGGEGELGLEPGWFSLWPAEKVLETNAAYEVAGTLPGFVAFGGSGGGEMFVFDGRGGAPFPVCVVPFVSLDPVEVITLAPDFLTFALALGRPLDDM